MWLSSFLRHSPDALAAPAAVPRRLQQQRSQRRSPPLPEELILYILSFGGCAELAKAATLSRRFRKLLGVARRSSSSSAGDGGSLAEASRRLWREAYRREYGGLSHRECALLGPQEDWRAVAVRRARPPCNFRRGDALITRLTGHTDWVCRVYETWSQCITASRDATIRVWSSEAAAASGPPKAVLRGHTCMIRALKANERVVVSGSADRTLRVWNLRTGVSGVVGSHDASISCLDVDLSQQELAGGLLVSGAGDNVVRMWDLETCQPLGVKSGPSGWISSLKLFSPEAVICGSQDKVIRVFDIREPDHSPPALTLLGHVRKVYNVELLEADPHLVLSESHSGQEVMIWDTRRPGQPVHHIQRDRLVTAFGLSGAEGAPMAASGATSVHQHQSPLQPPLLRNPIRGGLGGEAEGVQLLQDPEAVAAVGAAGQRGDLEDYLQAPPADGGRQLFALGLEDGTIEVWDPVLGQQTHRSPLTGTRSPVTCCTLQQDGRLVAGHKDGRISGWDTQTGSSAWVYQSRDLGMPVSLAMSNSKVLVGTRSSSALMFDFDSPLLGDDGHEEEPVSSSSGSGSSHAWWRRMLDPFTGRGVSGPRTIMRSGEIHRIMC